MRLVDRMSHATLPTTTDLAVSEALDFDPEVSCSDTYTHPSEAPPGDWWIHTHCRGVVAYCDPCVKRVLKGFRDGPVECALCGRALWRDPEIWPVRS